MENIIWFRLVVLAILVALASAGNGTTALKSNLNSGSRRVTYMHEKIHLLHRKKRWLTFELGAALTVTGNCAKAVIDTIPKGLVWLAEMTSLYELPAAVEDWIPRRVGKPKVKPVPPPPPPPPPPPSPPPPPPLPASPGDPIAFQQQPVIVPLNPADPIQSFYFAYPQGIPLSPNLSRRKSYSQQMQMGCPASHLVKDMYGTYYCRPSAMSRRLRRELESQGKRIINEAQSPQGMLFDLITMMAAMFNYQPDYCIMRTLCEARHLLAPPGLTLFHDIFRIMLRYVHPEIAHKPKYREAFTAGRSLHDCASLYGPHCRQSFLLLISERFQEKYAR
ncbi:uncharacterized protein LOC119552769 [Drosophila subpulchrella]|uniref:uncharacterized protein LOC119552769 n=1 Tax=Drosophila subpulchrella TaxID=1486046 RepID=UPI0018A17F57|nr:uncharacterized protein LOC119552769 [Drosophila subpulchrella]